ncbi:MAG: protein kinase [Gemmataceae bacterium]
MLLFFQCVAEAAVENGLRGLAEMVPGGKYVCDVAEGAYRKYRQRCAEAQQRAEILQLAQISIDEARSLAAQAVQQVVPPESPPEESSRLALYLSAVPDAVRQSLKRPEDPTGATVPPAFVLHSGDDVVKLLPQRPPRFQPGDDLPGKPGWVVERLLGVGGFGEVWFARHGRMTSLSGAVKFCLGESARSLVHEAGLIDRVMQMGRHPNLVPLVDVHLDGPTPWIMFEFVAGGNLTDWIHRLAGQPAEKRVSQVLAALRQLTSAVALFHGLTPPIVHRDLKPSNVLLDRASKALRITDFGIGGLAAQDTLRNESRGHTTSGGRLQSYLRGSHTPLYASPQQRTGADADPRDDVHALGVIAYQMLTGHLTQGAGPDFAEDLREAGAEESLIELLGRCVAQKPDRRPKDARELSERLASLASPKAQGPIPDPPATKPAQSPVSSPTSQRVEPAPPPPATPVEWTINVPGTWNRMSSGNRWIKISDTPARITPTPGESYQLSILNTATNSDLQPLQLLQGLSQLLSLYCFKCKQITDVGLAHLKGLTQLQSLNLGGCEQIKDDGLAHLQGLSQLQSLELRSCREITDAGLAHLKKLTQLRSLCLLGCGKITDKGVAHLQGLSQLQSLNLSGCSAITDRGLAHLRGLSQLQSLNFSWSWEITDVGLAHLRGLTQLQSLALTSCSEITDAGLAHLRGLTQLQSLYLGMCKKLTDAGVAQLQGALPQCKIRR